MFNGDPYCLFTLDSQSRPLSQSSHAQKTMSCETHFYDLNYTFACTLGVKKKTRAVSFLVTSLCTFVTVKMNLKVFCTFCTDLLFCQDPRRFLNCKKKILNIYIERLLSVGGIFYFIAACITFLTRK